MKQYKLLLRLWIGIASLAGFLGGWVMLAHSGKPAPFFSSSVSSSAVNSASAGSGQALNPSDPNSIVPTLPPLPTLQGSSGTTTSSSQSSIQLSVPSFSVSSSLPTFRTRGS